MKSVFENNILKYCSNNKIDSERVHLPDSDEFEFVNIAAGAVFIYTPSSAPSLQSLRLFLNTVACAQDQFDRSLELFFFNSELSEFPNFASRLNIDSQGYGEVYWISNGKIIHSDRGTKTEGRKQEIIKFMQMVLTESPNAT